ncbi:MAG: phosphoesterase, partial [Actinobacteria bacterium]|nr:phosphoesterase [Actinomycetota bacterium]
PSNWLSQVQAGRVKAVLSARLGGYAGQQDNATVVAHFLDSGGVDLKTLQIGPVTVSDRSGLTKFLPRTATVAVPAQTTGITIVITSTRVDGQYNDAYVDNVSLVLKR